uniref:C-C motif chemokine n=1 Tax=Gallus gallus TaxID=9031 RepID=Q5IEZ5_CHICK|nr:chemokine-like ligand 4 precursor [Gallus gallus]AAW34404.1 chemokine-like ligand 1 [Gallus gallus]AAX83391.1 chemokine-like ligand 1 [Gallus gallus]|eukprot:NP_001039296.1 chemokine-like ligand 4 precursor [Gallus gallus]
MKSSTAAIAVLIVAALCYQVSSTPLAVGSNGRCCYKFLNRALPSSKVMMYEYTGSRCPYHGVIFTTFEGKKCCANPEEKWVQDILNVEKHTDGSK